MKLTTTLSVPNYNHGFQQWLLSNGFIASQSSSLVNEFVKPFESGDSLYVQIHFDDKGKHSLSIHSDAPHWASSSGLKLPTSEKHAKLLFWFHGLDI